MSDLCTNFWKQDGDRHSCSYDSEPEHTAPGELKIILSYPANEQLQRIYNDILGTAIDKVAMVLWICLLLCHSSSFVIISTTILSLKTSIV